MLSPCDSLITAFDLLLDLQVETYSSTEHVKKTKFILKQMLLLLHANYAYLSSTYVDKDQYEGQYFPGAVG